MKKVQEKGGEFVKAENERLGRILSKYTTYNCTILLLHFGGLGCHPPPS